MGGRRGISLLFLNFGISLSDLRTTGWKGRERKWSRSNLKYYTAICGQELRKTTKKLKSRQTVFCLPGLNFNPGPPEYEARMGDCDVL